MRLWGFGDFLGCSLRTEQGRGQDRARAGQARPGHSEPMSLLIGERAIRGSSRTLKRQSSAHRRHVHGGLVSLFCRHLEAAVAQPYKASRGQTTSYLPQSKDPEP